MDFTVADDLAAHRDAAQAWVRANARPEWVEEQHHSGLYQTMELHALLADTAAGDDETGDGLSSAARARLRRREQRPGDCYH